MFEAIVALIVVIGLAALILIPFFASETLVILLAPLVPLAVVIAFVVRSRLSGFSYRRWRITPERITQQTHRAAGGKSPEALSRSIVERSAAIRRAMQDRPSAVQIEMYALGYRSCVNDMITLTNLISEELPNSSLVRRAKLRKARRRATDALTTTRQALPPGALRATRQEQQ